MKIEELHAKFKDASSPSPQAQIKWLSRQGFTPAQIEQAMLLVYQEIEQGKIFINGFELDQYLLLIARSLQQTEQSEQLKKIELVYDKMKTRWDNEKRPGLMTRIKKVFVK